MKNLLIITYYWPPGSGPGVQRWLKFAKFLPEYGWKPFILTVKNGSYPSTDPSLLQNIPGEATVFKTKTIEPFALYNLLRGKRGKQMQVGMPEMRTPKSLINKLANYIRANYFIPDARKGWNITAYPKALEIIRKHHIDAVITTGPPHSSHLIGLKIRTQRNIPWIADFRDPWTNIYYNAFLNRTEQSKKRDRKLETEVLTSADAVTVVSPEMQREFANRTRQIEIIYNGYDPEDIPDKKSEKTEKFVLAYIGNLKENQNLTTLLGAMQNLSGSVQGFSDAFRFSVTGNVAPGILREVGKANLGSIWQRHPFVPHRQATQRMVDANLLLLPIPNAKNNKGILTGKIFEYLSSRTPILAIGPTDGDAALVLNRLNRDPMLDDHDAEGIQNYLESAFLKWQKKGHQSAVIEGNAHMQFSRRQQTAALAQLLRQITQDDKTH